VARLALVVPLTEASPSTLVREVGAKAERTTSAKARIGARVATTMTTTVVMTGMIAHAAGELSGRFA
jgi:hypothetical protein